MKDKNLGVVATAVSLMEPRDSASKIAAAAKLFEEAAHFHAHLVVFPAGFLLAFSEDDLHKRARPLISAARKQGIGVAFGIDVEKHSWLGAWVPGMRSAEIWCDRDSRPRTLLVDGFNVAVLSEFQLRQARHCASVVAARPDLVAICAHQPFNRRLRELERFRRRGFPVVPSNYTHQKAEVVPLVCPAGYRMPNLSYMHDVFSLSYFFLDERDGAIAA